MSPTEESFNSSSEAYSTRSPVFRASELPPLPTLQALQSGDSTDRHSSDDESDIPSNPSTPRTPITPGSAMATESSFFQLASPTSSGSLFVTPRNPRKKQMRKHRNYNFKKGMLPYVSQHYDSPTSSKSTKRCSIGQTSSQAL